MKNLYVAFFACILFIGCKNEKKENEITTAEVSEMNKASAEKSQDYKNIKIDPISHATAVFEWDGSVFYSDPVGGAEAFSSKPAADFILVTDIHGDHMNAETLQGLELEDSVKIIAPQAVKDALPEDLQPHIIVMNNGESLDHKGFNIKAIPMYNLPQSKDAMHVKGRGNGYVIEKDDSRLYLAGDTEDIEEMRSLKNIDIALVPMNLPYTMTVEDAADAVLDFKPKKVIPFHFRGKNGYADVEKFRSLVNEGNADIEVEMLEWYPDRKQ